MTQTAVRPATLRGSEQAENQNLAWQRVEVLNTKSVSDLQPRCLISYSEDARLNVVNVRFSQEPNGENLS